MPSRQARTAPHTNSPSHDLDLERPETDSGNQNEFPKRSPLTVAAEFLTTKRGVHEFLALGYTPPDPVQRLLVYSEIR